MNKKYALTLLGCSSSFSFMLLTGQVANARPVVPPDAGTTTTAAQTTKVPLAQEDPPYSSLASSGAVEDLAIAKLGCDCPGCRSMGSQMVQKGSLAPQ